MTQWDMRALIAAAAVTGAVAGLGAQDWKTKSPTAAEWAAMSRLPDFNGVWEAGRPPGAAPAAGGARAGGGAPTAATGAARAGGAPNQGGAAARGGGAPAGRGGAPAGPQLTPA